jgi:hypothetical protein
MRSTDGPVRVHLERRGPAFLPLPIAESLGQSLMAQAVTVCGNVLQAIEREQPLDVAGAWDRMLRVLRVQPGRAQVVPSYGSADRWKVLRILTQAALANMTALDASRHWLNADAYVRTFLKAIAVAKLKEADALANLSVLDELEDGPADTAYVAQLRTDADALLQFAEGQPS